MDRPSAYKGEGPYVFVCHAHADQAVVNSEINWLSEQGINIWYDEGIRPGAVWNQEIADAIENASLFLYLVTPTSVESSHCQKEVNFSITHDIPFVAVHLEQTEMPSGMELTLNNIQAIFKHELGDDVYKEKLLTSLVYHINGRGIGERTDAPVQSSSVGNNKLKITIGVALVVAVSIAALWIGFLSEREQVQESGSTELESSEDAAPQEAMMIDPSIAVLPFVNMSGDEEARYFAEGLAEEILDSLAKRQFIQVASRTSTLQYSKDTQDIRIIADTLSVAYILEGSVRRAGNDLRITAQLIRAEDNQHLWSAPYDEVLENVFTLQKKLAENIALLIESSLVREIWFASLSTDNEEAKLYFIRAHAEFTKVTLGTGGDWQLQIDYYEKAIELDPEFFEAYQMLSNAYAEGSRRQIITEALPAARSAIDKAISIAPEHELTYQMDGHVNVYLELDYRSAMENFNKVLSKTPGHTLANKQIARIERREGRADEALTRLRSAVEVGAAFVQGDLLAQLSTTLTADGRYEEAQKVLDQLLTIIGKRGRAPTLYLLLKAENHYNLGDVTAANKAMDRAWGTGGHIWPEFFPGYLALLGREDHARQILNDLEERHSAGRYVVPHNLFFGYYRLDDLDLAFIWLKRSIENRDVWLVDNLRGAKLFTKLKEDPRYQEMVELLDSMETHTELYLLDQDRKKPTSS